MTQCLFSQQDHAHENPHASSSSSAILHLHDGLQCYVHDIKQRFAMAPCDHTLTYRTSARGRSLKKKDFVCNINILYCSHIASFLSADVLNLLLVKWSGFTGVLVTLQGQSLSTVLAPMFTFPFKKQLPYCLRITAMKTISSKIDAVHDVLPSLQYKRVMFMFMYIYTCG